MVQTRVSAPSAVLAAWFCGLARALAGYVTGGHRRRVEQRLDDGFEFGPWDFGDCSHETIVKQNRVIRGVADSVNANNAGWCTACLGITDGVY